MKLIFDIINIIKNCFRISLSFEKAVYSSLQAIGGEFGLEYGGVWQIEPNTPIQWEKGTNSFSINLFGELDNIFTNLINKNPKDGPLTTFREETQIIQDLADEEDNPFYSIYLIYGYRGLFLHPLIIKGEVLGYLYFIQVNPLNLSANATQTLSVSLIYLQELITHQLIEAHLQKSIYHLNTILNLLPNIILICNKDGIITHSFSNNHPAFSVRTIENQSIQKIFPKELADLLFQLFLQVVNSESPKIDAVISSTSSSISFDVHIVLSGADEFVVILKDISEKLINEQYNTDLIYRISHELRTPLTTMILVVDLIQEGGEPEEIESHWSILRSELERQKILIEKLLMMGRLESGNLKLQFSPIDIAKEIKKSFLTVQSIADSKNIQIKGSLSKKLPVIQADPIGIGQILINLLNNAIKYSHNNSTINIIAKSQMQLSKDGKNKNFGVCIQIKDSGIGIPKEDQSRLFQRFFRAQNAVEEEISGSGVGLYIVKSIIEEHNGFITISSKLHHGTVVTIWLPTSQK